MTNMENNLTYEGGILTGSEIQKQIEANNISIIPYDTAKINPNSYNLTLSNKLLIYADTVATTKPSFSSSAIEDIIVGTENGLPLYMKPWCSYYLDMSKKPKTIELTIPEEGMVLWPNMLYIGSTNEKTFTDKFIPMINGRSSGGRWGISIHICAGFGDIGFDGTWTLEITVIHPLLIKPNQELSQICYHTPYGNNDILYNGRYNGQTDPTASRFYLLNGEKE